MATDSPIQSLFAVSVNRNFNVKPLNLVIHSVTEMCGNDCDAVENGACESFRHDKLVDGNAVDMKLEKQIKRQRTKRVRHRKPTKDTIYKCAVCGDVAFGYNFNAITCESCKAFFRRNSSSPSNPYECPNTKTCRITKSTRKYCPACRFDKCLNMGMKREAIDQDGNPASISSGDESTSSVGERKSLKRSSHSHEHDDHDHDQSLSQSLSHSPSQTPSPASSNRKDEASLPLKKRLVCGDNEPHVTKPETQSPLTSAISELRQKPATVDVPSSIGGLGRLAAISGVIGNVDEFNSVYATCQRYASTMMQPLQSTGGLAPSINGHGRLDAHGSAPTGFGEVLAKRFVRFAKCLADFASLDSVRQFSVLQANFVTCHVVNYGYVHGSIGEAGALPPELSRLHESLKARFYGAGGVEWSVVLAALGLMTLFSPHRFVAPPAETERPGVIAPPHQHAQLLEVLYPLHYRYVRFLQQYLAAMRPRIDNGSPSDWHFCLETVSQVRTVGEQIALTSALGGQLTAVIADLLYADH